MDIIEADSFRGKSKTVLVKNDFKDEQETLPSFSENISIDALVQRIADAGITGKGGAGFPTHVKYSLEKKDTEYLVINGAECEPYLTTDHRVMIEYADELIEIAEFIGDLYAVSEIIFALENHDETAKNSLNKSIKKSNYQNIKVHELPLKYPAGHSDLQIKEVLGIEKDYDQISGDVGVLQSNVSTLKAIYDAVMKNETFHKRIITVSGPLVKEQKNIMVPIGTTVQYIIDHCGGLKDAKENIRMINGGPMMGRPFENTDIPINKETNGLLFLPLSDKPEESPCIRCAKCVNQCPVGLQPVLLHKANRQKQYELGNELKANSCISCGVCTYVCPAKIDLLGDIQEFREEMSKVKS